MQLKMLSWISALLQKLLLPPAPPKKELVSGPLCLACWQDYVCAVFEKSFGIFLSSEVSDSANQLKVMKKNAPPPPTLKQAPFRRGRSGLTVWPVQLQLSHGFTALMSSEMKLWDKTVVAAFTRGHFGWRWVTWAPYWLYCFGFSCVSKPNCSLLCFHTCAACF